MMVWWTINWALAVPLGCSCTSPRWFARTCFPSASSAGCCWSGRLHSPPICRLPCPSPVRPSLSSLPTSHLLQTLIRPQCSVPSARLSSLPSSLPYRRCSSGKAKPPALASIAHRSSAPPATVVPHACAESWSDRRSGAPFVRFGSCQGSYRFPSWVGRSDGDSQRSNSTCIPLPFTQCSCQQGFGPRCLARTWWRCRRTWWGRCRNRSWAVLGKAGRYLFRWWGCVGRRVSCKGNHWGRPCKSCIPFARH